MKNGKNKKMSFENFIKYWVPVMIWLVFIFWMSTNAFSSKKTALVIGPLLVALMPAITPSKLRLLHMVIRKAAHITEYFVLGMLLFRGFRGTEKERKPWRWAVFSLMAVSLYALSDEFHQTFVPSRGVELSDVGIDIVAGGVALAISVLFYRLKRSGRVRL